MGSVKPSTDPKETPYLVQSNSQQSKATSTQQAALDDVKTLHDDYQKQMAATGQAGMAYLNGQISEQEYGEIKGQNQMSWVNEFNSFTSHDSRDGDLRAALSQTYGDNGGQHGWPQGEAAITDANLQTPAAGPSAKPAHIDDAATATLRTALAPHPAGSAGQAGSSASGG